MVKVVKKLSNNENHYPGHNPANYITIHQTDNEDLGANADMHARYINNGSSETWHYTVDDEKAVQHFRHNVQCWHAGDGTGAGNTQSIGIELCINSDGNYNKTIDNAIDLVKQLMKNENIPIDKVVQHYKWSGKNCPSQIRSNRNGVSWTNFINNIKYDNIDTNHHTDLDALAEKVIRGDYGTGSDRRKALGNKYDAVQRRVNEKLSSNDKSIEQLAQDVINGKLGNGEERKQKLGSKYNAVQKRVNELME